MADKHLSVATARCGNASRGSESEYLNLSQPTILGPMLDSFLFKYFGLTRLTSG